MSETDHPAVPRSPGALDVAILFGLPVAITAVSHVLARSDPFFTLANAMLFTAVATAMAGLPALAWSLEAGRGRLTAMLLAGALAGAVPLLLLLLSAVVRLYVLYGPGEAHGVLAETAVLPARGRVRWSRFVLLTLQSAAVGAATAIAIWLLRADQRHPFVLRLTLGLLVSAAAVFVMR